MTEAELLEYISSYSVFLNSIKEIYKSMELNLTPHLNFCKFAPDIDDETLRDTMNNYAKNEEPLAILCVGDAKGSAGFFASITGNSYSEFLFTTQLLYLKSHAIKLSEINSIDYKEETKTSLFGKAKIESFLVVTKKTGIAETFKGGIAVQAIAEFFNAVVKAFNENPQKELPVKEYQRTKLIVDALDDLKIPSFNRDFDHKVLNSIIIKFGKDELKSSFAASFNKELYFSNDNLYLTSNGNYKRIPYTDLLKAVYKKEENLNSNVEIEITYETSLYDKNNEIVFTISDKPVNKDEKLADFFSMIISDATGTEIKTEIQVKELPIEKKREIKIKDIIIEASKDENLLSAYKIDGDFTDLSKNGIAPYLKLEKNYKYWAFCLDSVMFADGNVPWKTFKYQTISKTALKRIGSGGVDLVLYNHDGQEICSFPESDYFTTNFRVISRFLADLINKIISELTGKVIKTEFIDSRTPKDVIRYSSHKECDNLLKKWDDVFLKETSIEYRKFTTAEKNELPKWLEAFLEDFVYFMGNDMRKAIFVNGNLLCYFPDLYSENEKILRFEYYYDSEKYSTICSLDAKSGNTSVSHSIVYRNYNGTMNEPFTNNGQAKFPGSYDISMADFFKLLGKEEFVRNYTSFKEKKLRKAEAAYLIAKKNAKGTVKAEGVEAEAAKAKKNLINDLNNW